SVQLGAQAKRRGELELASLRALRRVGLEMRERLFEVFFRRLRRILPLRELPAELSGDGVDLGRSSWRPYRQLRQLLGELESLTSVVLWALGHLSQHGAALVEPHSLGVV